MTELLFLDLKKALDTVRHETFLQKSDHSGIRRKVSDLFRYYLLDRGSAIARATEVRRH